jgi:DNA-directed RNA polymerase specialized sigma subunit
MKTSISVGSNDGMPRGSGQSDLSSYAATLDKLERDLVYERYNRINLYMDIGKRIESLPNSNERDVLFFRYIKGLDWYEIAEKMNYSERWIHKIHGKALVHFDFASVYDDL